MVKNLPANAGDTRDVGSIPGLGRSPGGENNNPLQNSCLENSMDRGAWQTTVDGVAKSWTQLSTHTQQLAPISNAVFLSHSTSLGNKSGGISDFLEYSYFHCHFKLSVSFWTLYLKF